jgi:hypothetical protein
MADTSHPINLPTPPSLPSQEAFQEAYSSLLEHWLHCHATPEAVEHDVQHLDEVLCQANGTVLECHASFLGACKMIGDFRLQAKQVSTNLKSAFHTDYNIQQLHGISKMTGLYYPPLVVEDNCSFDT